MMRCFLVMTTLLLVFPRVWADENCKSSQDIHVYCGFQAPEDLVHVPNSPFMIVSQYGGHVKRDPNSLMLFNMETKEKEILFPRQDVSQSSVQLWGAKDCLAPPETFSPHGIDLGRHQSGELMLLVVNHAKVDSIQFFKVTLESEHLSLQWRGCVAMPEHFKLNDVAVLPTGGFAVPARKISPVSKKTKQQSNINILLWRKGGGLSTLLTGETGYGNGVAVTPDSSHLYVNDTAGSRVMKISLDTGKKKAQVSVKYPDNSSWSRDGKLLVTSILFPALESLDVCDRHIDQPCDIPFEVHLLDPGSLQTTSVIKHGGSQPFGGATVAVQVNDDLYLGSAFGDRIAKIRMPE